MSKRSSVPNQDAYGEPIEPGDVIIYDALGRPLKVHPSRVCRCCGEIRYDDSPVCVVCGTVTWRRPIQAALTTGVLLAGAFAGDRYFSSPWGAITFWVLLVFGSLWALAALSQWHQALKGVGIEVLRIVGGALLFGGIGWFIDWCFVENFGICAIIGAIGGACLEFIAEQYYFHRDR